MFINYLLKIQNSIDQSELNLISNDIRFDDSIDEEDRIELYSYIHSKEIELMLKDEKYIF